MPQFGARSARPSPHSWISGDLRAKGADEAGAIGSCPAAMNAIVDALWRAFRIRHIDMPATPERIWAAIEEGRRVHTLQPDCSCMHVT